MTSEAGSWYGEATFRKLMLLVAQLWMIVTVAAQVIVKHLYNLGERSELKLTTLDFDCLGHDFYPEHQCFPERQ